MTGRHYGYRYDEAGDKSAAEIAKRIRADVKQAVTEGLLPLRWTYSVRSDSYSGGCSIDVRVRSCDDAWQECDGSVPGTRGAFPDGTSVATSCPDVWCAARNDSPHARAHQVLTEEARAARMTLERIHGAYNHDGSDTMTDYFDVNYYGQVTFEDASDARFHAEQLAKRQAKADAKSKATVYGLIRVWARRGASPVHVVLRTPAGKDVLACGAQLWRSSLTDVVPDASEVTCSRCKKYGPCPDPSPATLDRAIREALKGGAA